MNEIIEVIEKSGLKKESSLTIKESFVPFFDQAEEWKQKAESLVVTDESQVDEMKQAREARLALKKIRVDANNVRKSLKEDSLRYGKAVQGAYNIIEYLIVPIEQHLESQEKFIEIKKKERIYDLKCKRETELSIYEEFIPSGLDFGGMSEDDYQKLLSGAKLQLQQRVEAELKAAKEEEERIKADEIERKRIEAENKKLKIEADKREKEIQKEREAAEKERVKVAAKAKVEQDKADAIAKAEREKLEAEKAVIEEVARKEREAAEKIKADAEAKQREIERIEAEKIQAQKAKELEEAKAQKALELAPDKDKLIAFAKQLDSLDLPQLKTKESQKIVIETKELLNKVTKYIREQTTKL